MVSRDGLGWLLTSWVLSRTILAQPYDCPLGWTSFEDHCYHFVFYPTQTYHAATATCEQDGAYLLSVNSEAEHTFISQRLTRTELDRARRWWTSGTGAGQTLVWEGDSTKPTLDMRSKWTEEGVSQKANMHIVYAFTTTTNSFLWNRQPASVKSPYICEISREESFRILQAHRDFSYGTPYTNPAAAPRGPRFTILPESVVVEGRVDFVYLECSAFSIPPSTYSWYRQTSSSLVMVTPQLDSRYNVVDGRLSIQNPQEDRDAGAYYCTAVNDFGTVRTHTVRISFGYIGEFSNDQRSPVRASLFQGTAINCNPPRYNPDASFQWFKGPGLNFVRPHLNLHQFVSYNGRLYFSETQRSDAGMYYCVVTLTTPRGQRAATVQPPSRTSLGIELLIRGDTATDFGPNIHSDFPAVFPSPPLRGERLRIECFAYGRLPLLYTWRRDNGPIPQKASFLDDRRVLILPDAQVEDSGNYTCRVERAGRATDTSTISLLVQAAPFFMFPLRDQHVDINSTVSLRCQAGGVPTPTYAWFKNGQPLTSMPDDVEVSGNVVVIKKAEPGRHSGMYECMATNLHGTRISSAQLRILAFAPVFKNQPVLDSQMATREGNTTVVCQPEASPAPAVTWSFNGRLLDLIRGVESRVMLLTSGNLLISQIQQADQGRYTCTAENLYGAAVRTVVLNVLSKTSITLSPRDTHVDVNGSAFLQCQASFDRKKLDLVYTWSFNGVPIDSKASPTFKQLSGGSQTGLYIINTQFEHEGVYTCRAMTVDDSAVSSAYLTVQGPPSEPAGLYGQVRNTSVILTWTPGESHGADILFFSIQFKSSIESVWRFKYTQLPIAETVNQEQPTKCSYIVTDLSPGSSFSFRVSAVNRYGVGVPSQPSAYFKIPDAAPRKAPDTISNMFSSMGTLAFTWTELKPEDLTGDGVGYKVYWRKKSDSISDDRWQSDTVTGRTNSYVALVGEENFYLEYEVKVGAFNSLGNGPNTTVYIIMSAEALPAAAPRNVYGYGYNATAVTVFWNRLDNTRQFVRGKLRGFRINYWLAKDASVQRFSKVWCESCTTALVVGLLPNEGYWVNVQAFNAAGLGPKGENYYMITLLNAPLRYPEYVMTTSHSNNSVQVQWRGVYVGIAEEPLVGYKLRWWPATENVLTAHDTVVLGHQTSGVIVGIKRGIVYALRVLGFSLAGDGNKSPTVYFTLEGMVVFNPETTDVLAGAHHTTASKGTVMALCSLSVLLVCFCGENLHSIKLCASFV